MIPRKNNMDTFPLNRFQPLISHKKPLISQNLDAEKQSIPLLKKFAPKYARHASIPDEDFRKRGLSYLKSVASLSFDPTGLNRFEPDPRSQIFQFIKSHKKFIHYCQGIYIDLCLVKELPGLWEYELNYLSLEPEKEYHILGYLFALKKLFFNLNYQFEAEAEDLIGYLIHKNRTRITRAISRMRSIDKFSLDFSSQSSIYFLVFLQIFGSCPLFLSNLQHFSIRLLLTYHQEIPEWLRGGSKVQMALRYITHLDIPDHEWFEILFDKENWKTLVSLKAEILTKEVPETTVRKLSELRSFTNLKNLDLNFRSFSHMMEHVFLESFTLPKDIESVRLKLDNFAWDDEFFKLTENNRKIILDSFKNAPRFQNFYSQWEGLSNLKALVLKLDDYHPTRGCPVLALSFAEGILKRVKNLRKIHYEYYPQCSFGMNDDLNIRLPMDLREFWDYLESSNEALEDLEICVFSKLNFFEKESLENLMELRNLKSLRICGGDIFSGVTLGNFLMKLSKGRNSTVKVLIENVCFAETKELKDFFINIYTIPRYLDVELTVNISSSSWIWGDILCDYMIKVRGEGKLSLNLRLDMIGHRKILELMKEKSVRNSVLKRVVIREEKFRCCWSIQNGTLTRE